MTTEPIDPQAAARRASLVQAAIGVFLRYGYKKTSMDDLARAAGISRQGLYLHFPNKEELFKAAVGFMAQNSLAALRAALARDELPVDERVLGAFVALKSHIGGHEAPPSQEHMNELFATAVQLVGPVIEELDKALVADLARVLQASGVGSQWKGAGLSAKDLARHLQAASHGIKHQTHSVAEYKDRMRVAVRLVCLGTAPSPSGHKAGKPE
jgi:AcrR family transcriptional regulator